MGSRTADNEKAKAFVSKHNGKASAGTFSDAAAFGEIIFNCTAGVGSLDALNLAGENNRQVVSSALGNRSSYLVLDVDKTRSLLQWSPEVNIKDGLLQLLKLKMNNE
jgi:hypothetical protein